MELETLCEGTHNPVVLAGSGKKATADIGKRCIKRFLMLLLYRRNSGEFHHQRQIFPPDTQTKDILAERMN